MTDTTSSSVANHILSEVLSVAALSPLRGRNNVLLSKLNTSNIGGRATKNRKIPKRTAIAAAVDDTEGTEFTNAAQLTYGTSITLTPTTKVQGVIVTVDALELCMPGVTRRAAMAAIASGDPSSIPLAAWAVEELYQSHLLRAETDALALFSSASESAASSGNTPTAAPLSFAVLLDAQMKILDNNPESEDIAFMVEEQGVADLRALAAGGSGAALSTLFTSGTNLDFFAHRPDVGKTGARGGFAGMPIFSCNKAIMATANSAADRVGAVIVVGRGETATAGSIRGFAEFCERFEPDIGFEYDLGSDTLKAIGRWAWDVEEHTDEHIVKLVYDVD